MTISIKFPCGCEINETCVLAMCVMHGVVLRQARIDADKQRKDFQKQMLEGIEHAISQRG